MRKPFIAGNWKMFKNKSEAVKFADQFKSIYKNKNVDTVICAPFVHLQRLVERVGHERLGGDGFDEGVSHFLE